MQIVIQQESTGCGIACVATIAGLSYPQAKVFANDLGISANNPLLWSSPHSVRQMLVQCAVDIDASETLFTDWQSLPDCALLSLKWHIHQDTPFWHWAVFLREQNACYVLDPNPRLRCNRRTDFGRMRPQWYIGVQL